MRLNPVNQTVRFGWKNFALIQCVDEFFVEGQLSTSVGRSPASGVLAWLPALALRFVSYPAGNPNTPLWIEGERYTEQLFIQPHFELENCLRVRGDTTLRYPAQPWVGRLT